MIVALSALFACSTPTAAVDPCSAGPQSLRLIAENSKDCKEDLACLAKAVKANTPVSSTFVGPDIDGTVTSIHIFDGKRYWVLVDESDTVGVHAMQCVGPTFGSDAVGCEQLLPIDNQYRMCGDDNDGAEPFPED